MQSANFVNVLSMYTTRPDEYGKTWAE